MSLDLSAELSVFLCLDVLYCCYIGYVHAIGRETIILGVSAVRELVDPFKFFAQKLVVGLFEEALRPRSFILQRSPDEVEAFARYFVSFFKSHALRILVDIWHSVSI